MKTGKKYMTMTLAFTILFLLVAVNTSAAATLTVTSLNDNGDGTLRAALANASEGDTIEFSLSGLPATITLNSGQLAVNKSLTIIGPGQDQLAVDGGDACSVFGVGPDKTVTISGLAIFNGAAKDHYNDGYYGGGVLNSGNLTLRDCTLTENEADLGGAVYNEGTLTLTGCTLSQNEAYEGGAIFNKGTLTLTDCTLSDNTASGGGYSDVDFVSTGFGGAIRVESYYGDPVTLTVDRCTLSYNTASGENAHGGGISVSAFGDDSQVIATVLNSTFVSNTASASSYAVGGAIANGEFNNDIRGGNVFIGNCTLTNNSALGETAGGVVGAILNVKGILTVDNSTLAHNYDNIADFDMETPSCSGILTILGPLKIKNTILANDPSGMNLFSMSALVDDLGFNLCTDDGGGLLTEASDLLSTDPMLCPLDDNGGPTQTHALLEGSPAVDAGSETDIEEAVVLYDQRGVSRPQGEEYDIGAFELEVSESEYEWSGVLPPINSDGSSVFKTRSTVPVKFMLTGLSAGVTELEAIFLYTKLTDGSPGFINESVSTSAATTGNLFRYDPITQQYIFNWNTKGLSEGIYRIYIDFGDEVERFVDVGLR